MIDEEIEIRQEADKITKAFIAGYKIYNKLSARERDVFESVIILKMSFKDTALNYGIELSTVYTYWENLLKKIG